MPIAVGLLLSGCYVSTEYGKYPDGKFVQKTSLVREWTAQDGGLVLSDDDSFTATGLVLEYFHCSADGLREKSGRGTWSMSKGRESTSVLIDFDDGCSATLWTGESAGETVLWAPQAEDDTLILT